MDKFYEANASGSPPALPNPGSTGYPTDSNIGNAATTPGAYWFYAVTTEILNEILAASITPDKATLTQLRDSITTRINNAQWNFPAHGSYGTNGYQVHPPFTSGSNLDQWGEQLVTFGSNPTTFSVSFPYGPAATMGKPVVSVYDTVSPGTGNVMLVQVGSVSTSGFSGWITPNGSGRDTTLCWRARGTI
jgi:hypothetical protein